MKFMLKELKMGQQVQTIRGWEIDPDWRHTSTKGTVYRYDKKGKGFVPPPSEARSMHVDCPDPALCGGCDGWDETHYIDDAGDRFIPGTRQKLMHFPGPTHTSGWCDIEDATYEEIKALVYPSDEYPVTGPPPSIRFDDPRVVRELKQHPRGEFWFTRVKVEIDGKTVAARGDFVANITGLDQ